jgi:hypothetical protein
MMIRIKHKGVNTLTISWHCTYNSTAGKRALTIPMVVQQCRKSGRTRTSVVVARLESAVVGLCLCC